MLESELKITNLQAAAVVDSQLALTDADQELAKKIMELFPPNTPIVVNFPSDKIGEATVQKV